MVRARGWRRRLVELLAGTVAALALAVFGPAAAPTANAETLCSGYTSYQGTVYCPATIEGVKATQYGTGKQVFLDQALVSARTTTSVTVAQQRYRSRCSSGSYCGATIEVYNVYLTVPWSGTSRPAVGSTIKLYATTTTGNVSPRAYESAAPSCGDYC